MQTTEFQALCINAVRTTPQPGLPLTTGLVFSASCVTRCIRKLRSRCVIFTAPHRQRLLDTGRCDLPHASTSTGKICLDAECVMHAGGHAQLAAAPPGRPHQAQNATGRGLNTKIHDGSCERCYLGLNRAQEGSKPKYDSIGNPLQFRKDPLTEAQSAIRYVPVCVWDAEGYCLRHHSLLGIQYLILTALCGLCR